LKAVLGEEVEEPPSVVGKGLFPRAILSAFSGGFLRIVSKEYFGDRGMAKVPVEGGLNAKGREASGETPAAAAQAGVPAQPPAGWRVEVVKVIDAFNIDEEDIPEKILAHMKSYYYDKKYVVTYHHDTWGSCRRVKFLITFPDGTYLPDTRYRDHSSNKNAHVYRVLPIEEFLEKYAGKELKAFAFVQGSCNKANRYSFTALFRVVLDG